MCRLWISLAQLGHADRHVQVPGGERGAGSASTLQYRPRAYFMNLRHWRQCSQVLRSVAFAAPDREALRRRASRACVRAARSSTPRSFIQSAGDSFTFPTNCLRRTARLRRSSSVRNLTHFAGAAVRLDQESTGMQRRRRGVEFNPRPMARKYRRPLAVPATMHDRDVVLNDRDRLALEPIAHRFVDSPDQHGDFHGGVEEHGPETMPRERGGDRERRCGDGSDKDARRSGSQ